MLLIFGVVFSISVVAGQNIDTSVCQCEIAGGGGQWMGDTKDFCSGCDSVVKRLCLMSNGEAIFCDVTLNCTVRECTGHWSHWDNDGPCDQSCGSGFQNQKRICYKQGNNSMRDTLCKGSYGKTEESRRYPCKSARGCTTMTTIMARSPRIVPTTTTKRSTGKTNYETTVLSTIHKIMVPPSTTNTPQVFSSDLPNLTLPLVLSSVALVCIVIIIVFVIILRRKAKEKKLSDTSGSSEYNTVDDIMKPEGAHLYEEVGPASAHGRRNMQANNSNESLVVPNVIYTPFEYQKGYEVPTQSLAVNIGNGPSTSNHQNINGNPTLIREDSYVTLDDVKARSFV